MTRRNPIAAAFAVIPLAMAAPGLARGQVVLSDLAVLPASYATTSAYLPTGYVLPTSYTSAYIPTSYTSAYLPTSYTSAYLPTSYYATSYATRVRYRPRRFVERTAYYGVPSYPLAATAFVGSPTYLPTSYVGSAYLPTSYVLPSAYTPTEFITTSSFVPTAAYVGSPTLVATAASYADPCTPTIPGPGAAASRPVTPSSATAAPTGPAITSKPTGGSDSPPERNPTKSFEDPADEPKGGMTPVPPSSAAGAQPPPPPSPAAGSVGPPASSNNAQKSLEPGLLNPPEVDVPLPRPGQAGSSQPGETSYYRANKPTTYPEIRNILKGRVVSTVGEPEEGVTVILTNRTRAFEDRTARTDADGDFKVSLPEGDWSVKVELRSGRIAPVGRDYVTASSGRVTDPNGRDVRGLTITR